MHARSYRVLALVALLGSMLISPATAGAQQPAVVLLTLVDGTACRGPITGTTFNLVDQRADYACTDGRWILGEPFNLGDGRQVAMLGRSVAQGERATDTADPCQQTTCVVGLGMAEVSTTATLPRVISFSWGTGRSSGGTTCSFQDGETFYVGTERANYLCDPHLWNKDKGARQDLQYWIVGGPMALESGSGYPTVIYAAVVPQNTPLMNVPTPVCDKPFCVLYIQQVSLAPQ